MRRAALYPLLGLLALGLAGCENDGAAFQVDGRNHTITLVREQALPWSSSIRQALVPARFPQCQRRTDIRPGTPEGPDMELWWVGERLYVARQGKDWYAVGTEACQVQKMAPTGENPPGQLMGHFVRRNGTLSFEPVKASP